MSSSVRQRGASAAAANIDNQSAEPEPEAEKDNTSQPQPQPRGTGGRSALSQALTSTANLANLLPTGTLLAFQILTPFFTNNGACDSVTRILTLLLLLLLALSCFLACFTDTVNAQDGRVYHGLATFKGLWLFDYDYSVGPGPGPGLPDLSKYRIRPMDWVHALLSVLVFCAVALRDKNVLNCFYPDPLHQTQEVLDIVPVGIGLLCSLLFVVFPTTRHGIGYPLTPPPPPTN
ncbi:Protein DMP [Sesbania bispinosa]|nr:Protein DMP [Sesbania bispinosa]